uniref:Uncharacterized protein n=1 Tax=Triticum urartu TaxID=4572 RepID=A0A8R7JXR7_TRIUA
MPRQQMWDPHVIREVKMLERKVRWFLQMIRTKFSVFWHKFVEESFLQHDASMWWFSAIHSSYNSGHTRMNQTRRWSKNGSHLLLEP